MRSGGRIEKDEQENTRRTKSHASEANGHFCRYIQHLHDDFVETIRQIDEFFVCELICINNSHYPGLTKNIFEANHCRPGAHFIQAPLNGLAIKNRVNRTINSAVVLIVESSSSRSVDRPSWEKSPDWSLKLWDSSARMSF